MPRPKLEKIRLIYKVAGSETHLEMDLDPARTTSLFFDEHAAVEILGGFYESLNRTITKDQAIARFGIRAEAWFPKGKEVLPLNKEFMKLAWGEDKKEDKKRSTHGECLAFQRADLNSLPMVVGKDPTCMPNGIL
jgi:hypothetical protein